MQATLENLITDENRKVRQKYKEPGRAWCSEYLVLLMWEIELEYICLSSIPPRCIAPSSWRKSRLGRWGLMSEERNKENCGNSRVTEKGGLVEIHLE